MAAREGVEAAHDAPASVWVEPFGRVRHGWRALSLREKDSRQIEV
jgi:hypothetical protein